MSPVKRSNAAGFSHSLTADEAGKRRRLHSTSSPDTSVSSPRVSDVSRPAVGDQNCIPQPLLQEPASGPLLPTNPSSEEFEQMSPATMAFNQSNQAVPDSDYSSRRNLTEDSLWSDDPQERALGYASRSAYLRETIEHGGEIDCLLSPPSPPPSLDQIFSVGRSNSSSKQPITGSNSRHQNLASFAHSLTADEDGKQSSPNASMSSPRVSDVSRPEMGSRGGSIENLLWSDDYDSHEPSHVAATMAEYESILLNTDSADSSVGVTMAFNQSGQEATPDLDHSSQDGSMENFLWSDDYDSHEPSHVAATMAEYESILLNTDSADSSVEGDHASNDSTSLHAESSHESSPYHYLTSERRQAILDLFKNNPKKSNANIARAFGVSREAISSLREHSIRTVNVRRERSKRLTNEERQAILNIFKNEPEKSISSIAVKFNVTRVSISNLKKQFDKTGNIDQRERSKRLTNEERQAILNIFKNEPEKSISSIADEFDVTRLSILNLKKQFDKTGDVDRRESTRRLTLEDRQAILNIFKSNPKKSISSIADQFDVSHSIVLNLKKQFDKTGKIDRRESKRRLTNEERQAILNIFENEPEKSISSIADKFDVSCSSVLSLREQFNQTGNIDPRNKSKRLTFEERQTILNIFTNNPNRSSASIAGDFGVSRRTISNLREQFNRTGTIGAAQ